MKVSSILLIGVIFTQSFGYDRKDWLPSWGKSPVCGDTRSLVLQTRDELKNDSCSFKDGLWFDAYNNDYIKHGPDIDIDHVVSLKDADASGGASWPKFRKLAFANDTANLVITTKTTNRSKGDKTPVDWKPVENSCGYISRYVRVKEKYGLEVKSEILLLKELWCQHSQD